MNKIKSTSEESKRLYTLLSSKPQIDQKTEYYKGILLSKDKLHNAISKRIKLGYTKATYKILGIIPVTKQVLLDEADIARLEIELFAIEDDVYNKKQYLEHWLIRARDYDAEMDSITRECNANFDFVLKEAKSITNNIRLINTIKDYKNSENNQQTKNEFYLYLKQEVNNSMVHRKKS